MNCNHSQSISSQNTCFFHSKNYVFNKISFKKQNIYTSILPLQCLRANINTNLPEKNQIDWMDGFCPVSQYIMWCSIVLMTKIIPLKHILFGTNLILTPLHLESDLQEFACTYSWILADEKTLKGHYLMRFVLYIGNRPQWPHFVMSIDIRTKTFRIWQHTGSALLSGWKKCLFFQTVLEKFSRDCMPLVWLECKKGIFESDKIRLPANLNNAA